MEFAFVVTVGGVGFEDVAVAGFEEAEDAGFVDYSGTAVVCEGGEEVFVFAVFLIHRAEFGVVFAEECIGLGFGQLDPSAIGFAGLDLVTISNVGPMFRFMKRFKAFDYKNCTLKERQFHNASFGFLMGFCLLRGGVTLGCGEHLR